MRKHNPLVPQLCILFLVYSMLNGHLVASTNTTEAPLIEQVRLKHKPAEDFKRIKEYFTGKEYMGDRMILRTKPQQSRTGLYWIVQSHRTLDQLPPETQITLQYYEPGKNKPEQRRFILENAPKVNALYLGLNGKDAPPAEQLPLAWELRMEAPGGDLLARRKSYLWEMDAK